MTNEEEAKEIAERNKSTYYVGSRYLGGDIETADSYLECYSSAIQMAKWKDDRFYTILACVKYSLEKSQIDRVDEFINNIKKQWEG